MVRIPRHVVEGYIHILEQEGKNPILVGKLKVALFRQQYGDIVRVDLTEAEQGILFDYLEAYTYMFQEVVPAGGVYWRYSPEIEGKPIWGPPRKTPTAVAPSGEEGMLDVFAKEEEMPSRDDAETRWARRFEKESGFIPPERQMTGKRRVD